MTDRREYHRQYREKNKEKFAEYNRKYGKEYREKNKEKIAERMKEYKQTPAGIKKQRIANWKFNGVIHDNFDVLYERYLNTEFCELCNIKLTEDKVNTKTTRCLDHDHNTGEVRNIVCNSCNIKRG